MTPRGWVLGLQDFCLSFDFYWIVLISLRTFNSLLDEIGCYYRAYDKHNNNIICYKFGITRHFLIPKDSILKGFQLVHYNASFSCRSDSVTGNRIWGCNEKGSMLLLCLHHSIFPRMWFCYLRICYLTPKESCYLFLVLAI